MIPRVLYVIAFIQIATAKFSGLYIDNGIDQTLVQRSLSKNEKREVQDEILNLLGLPNRPRTRHKAIKGSAPTFLLDVYKSLLDNPSTRKTRSEFNLSEEDLQAIDESDVIMSFAGQSKHAQGMRHDKNKRLWFDVSEVRPGQMIVGAELRLYQSSNFSIPNESYVVSIYLVTKDWKGENTLDLVDQVNTNTENEGWLIFNMTGTLTEWIAFPDKNEGIYISVHPVDNKNHELKPEDIGIITSMTKSSEESGKQPFMVAFMRGGIERRRVRRDEGKKRKKKADFSDNSYLLSNPLTESPHYWTQSQRSCQIQTLYVSFKDLDWQDWIIAPEGYGAYYCSGECNFPLNAHMNATNHAIVQTLVHLMNPLQVPKPCCAPTKLSAISVLYFLDDSNVMLKKYKNMVVKSCGCH